MHARLPHGSEVMADMRGVRSVTLELFFRAALPSSAQALLVPKCRQRQCVPFLHTLY